MSQIDTPPPSHRKPVGVVRGHYSMPWDEREYEYDDGMERVLEQVIRDHEQHVTADSA